jgi:hypothetical protein
VEIDRTWSVHGEIITPIIYESYTKNLQVDGIDSMFI